MSLPLTARARGTFAPRPYQVLAEERARAHWASGSDRGALLVMATGTGKTATGLYIAERLLEGRGRMVWLAHREELLNQPLAALWYDRHAAGIVQANRDAADQRIVFGSFATLANEERLQGVLAHGRPDLLVVDEAHHSVSPSHQRVIEALRGPSTRLLGLTATADREDDRDLGDLWEVAHSYGIVDAIEAGFLLPPFATVARLPELDLTQVTGRRDYDDAQLGEALLKAHVVEHTVEILGAVHHAVRLPRRDESRELSARGRSVLVFTATVEQSRLTAEALAAAGWRARWVSGETPAGDRRRLLRAFQDGSIDVLCNAAVLTEGTDLPRCSCVVLARPTRSWSLYVQMLGRGLRLHEDQREALVLDLAGATEDHSLIAAPALVGGTRCKEAPNGQHRFGEGQEGRAVCELCEARLPCWACLSGGGSGQHDWIDLENGYRRCRWCRKPQCGEAPDGRHYWIPVAGFQRQCLYCEATIPVPLASLQDGRGEGGREPPPPAAWTSLRQLDRPVEVLDLGDHGLLYLVGDELAQPVWLPRRARNPRPLTDAPVDRWLALETAADLIRKAKKGWDPWRKESLFGGVGGMGDVTELRRHATGRAVAVGIASWR